MRGQWKMTCTIAEGGEREFTPTSLLSDKYEAQHAAALHALTELGLYKQP